MRALTVTVKPKGGFHSANDALAEEPKVTRVAVHHFQLLNDDTVVLLYELHGDLERAEEILNANSKVLSCEISGETTGLAFIHALPKTETKMLLEIPKQYGLAIDKPVEHTLDGSIRITLVGEESAIQDLISDIPPDIDVTIERIQPYTRTSLNAPAILTDRQHKIAKQAFEVGYFDTPRKVTQRELASQLNVSPATVGEHLRKIERRLIQHYLG